MIPPLALAAGAYAAGTILGALLGGPWWTTALLASTLAAAAALRESDARGRATLLAAVVIAAGGHARYEALAAAPPPALASLAGTHEVTGIAREDARLRGSLAQVDLDVERVDGAASAGGVRLRLRAPDPPLLAGERIRFTGRLEDPGRDEAPQDAFDYAAFLRSRDIHALSQYPVDWARLGQTAPAWRRALDALHRVAVEHIARTFPEPEAALAAGLLVGERGTLPAPDAEALRITGTTHLVVVSGQNIALLLGVAIAALTLVISRRRAALITLALLVPYVLLVGADPPVVRAAIMAVGIALASVTGRRTPGWVYLLYAVAVMLAVDPALARDIAFQLSATATAGVMLLAPPLRDAVFARFPATAEGARAALVEAAATATGASLVVVPVQVAAFERLVPWSVPANILVAPLYEASFAVSAAAAFLGGIPPLADAFGAVARFAPAAFLQLVRLLARLPGADVAVTAPLLAGAAFYALLALATWRIARHVEAAGAPALAPGRSSHLATTIALAVTAGGLWYAVLTPRDALASVTVLDVGQGLAILVEDAGRRVLIDAGPPDGAALRALPRAGASRPLDVIVVTHGDADHAGGVQDVTRRLAVGEVRAARGLSIPGDVPHEDLDIGDRIRVSDRVEIEVLGPPIATLPPAMASSNDTALVLLVRIGDRRILLPADVERDAERWLVSSGLDLRADVMVVPHHGSTTSSTRAFLDAVQPRVAVVSVGAHNPYGHPADEVLARYGGVRLYRTDESGDIALRSDGARLWVAQQHAPIAVPTRTPTPGATATPR
ncbi:MAG: DNA internalization-related competence protein ComEC/Rec2 [Dehalococcoidia bacterium]